MSAERRPRAHRGAWGLVALGVLVLAIVGFLFYQSRSTAQSKTQYVTSAVQAGTLTVAVSANGSAEAIHSATVDPSLSGTVSDLDVRLGSRVKKGQLLFEIVNASLDSNVAKARASYRQSVASVAKTRQQLAQAKSDLDSLRSRQKSNPSAVTDDQIAVAKDNVSAVSASLSATQADEHSAWLDYQQAIATADEREVTAPIGGYVTTLNVQNGDQLGNGSSGGSSASSGASGGGGSSSAPIVIADLAKLQAQVDIAQTDRPKVKTGQKVMLTFDAVPDLTISGHVTSIDAVGTNSQNVVTYGVTIGFDVQDSRLSPGMTLTASIITNVRPDVLLVPNSAVKTDTQGGSYVQVLASANGTPETRQVTVGAASDSQTEIVQGLKAGEEVVTQTVTSGAASTTGQNRGFGGAGGGIRALGGVGR